MSSTTHSLRRRAAGIAAVLCLGALPAQAQSPAPRLQFVLPPATWRLTLGVEGQPAMTVRENAQRPAVWPADIGATRLTARLSAPVWKRGLYTTIVTNDLVYDRIGLSYGGRLPDITILLPGVPERFGPSTLHTIQHELVVSHALTPRWRFTGALQHGFATAGGSVVSTQAYRAAGGAFISRVYRPTLQVGAGIVALNVAPYVIPTIRVLHVGQKWRTDILLPRAETFRDVGHGIEVGGVLRFTGNRWQGSGDEVPQKRIDRVTWQQASLGPAATLRVGARGLVQVETGVALRRMLVEGRFVPPAVSSVSSSPFTHRFDTEAGALVRMTGRLTF